MHIDHTDLEKFQKGTMDTRDMAAFLQHIENCEFCLEQMLCQKDTADIAAPSYLKDQIMGKTVSQNMRLPGRESQACQRPQILHYTLQTAVGIAAALFLVFSVGNIPLGTGYETQPRTERSVSAQRGGHRLYQFTKDISQSISESTGYITDRLNDLSSKLTNGGF